MEDIKQEETEIIETKDEKKEETKEMVNVKEDKKEISEVELLKAKLKEIEEREEKKRQEEEDAKFNAIETDKIKEEFTRYRQETNQKDQQRRLENKQLKEEIELLKSNLSEAKKVIFENVEKADYEMFLANETDFKKALTLAKRLSNVKEKNSQGATFADGKSGLPKPINTFEELEVQSKTYKPKNLLINR